MRIRGILEPIPGRTDQTEEIGKFAGFTEAAASENRSGPERDLEISREIGTRQPLEAYAHRHCRDHRTCRD